MGASLVAVVIDCRHPESLARFWTEALDRRIAGHWTDARGTRYVQLDGEAGTALLFQPVDEPKGGKNRLHLDIAPPEGARQDEEVARLVALGASVLSDEPDLPWVVLADPEGNEFCVLPPR
jgi:catechol 2,3-dioxygenase-like lactoylglutathione lyase family enzyme